jgi:hypothetical protein
MITAEEMSQLRAKKELSITLFQLLFVGAYVSTELLSIRLSLFRLNPPRLAITQALRYIGMAIAGFCIQFLHSCRREKELSPPEERLPTITSATLTLLDFIVDAAEKISHILAPSHIVESIFGFFSLFQTGLSGMCFGHPITILHLTGGIMQTYGYFVICTSCVENSAETVSRGSHPVFGSMSESAGLFFAVLSVVIRCLSITMCEALSSNVKITVGELCRGNGVIGVLIMIFYHGLVLFTNTEKYLFLISGREMFVLCVVFVIASGFQAYAAFWLVLHTKAVEYSRVVMFASVVFFVFRHALYKEDGAAYGFYQVPFVGAVITSVGFLLITASPPVGMGHFDGNTQLIEV